MKTILLIICGAIVVGSAGVAWHAARRAREADVAVAAAQQEVRASAAIRDAENRTAVADREAEKLGAVLAGLSQAKTLVKATPAAPVPLSILSAREVIRQKEEARKQRDEQAQVPLAQLAAATKERRLIDAAFGPLFRTLGLTPSQIERFKSIGVKSYEAGMDLRAIAGQDPATSTDPVVVQLMAEAKAAADAAYRKLLGEPGYQQFKQYERTKDVRNMLCWLAGLAVEAGAPYSAAQLEQLVPVFASASSSYQSGGTVDVQQIDWSLVDTQARPLMSEAQWQVFIHDDSRFKNQYYGAIANAKAAAASKTTPPAKPPGG
jgi:hypothetical protein